MTSMTETPRNDPVLREGTTLVESLTGIRIPDYRQPLLYAELERIGGRWGIEGGVRLIASGDRDARSQLISSITIPETYLFRHFGHFELLRELALQRSEQGRPTRVLSAGCSTGEEAWSAAAVLATVPSPADDNHMVMGWELCGERLKKARAGRFSNWSCRSGLKGHDRFFDTEGDEVVAGRRLREITVFQQVNLAESELPLPGGFDAILFRNVSIYWGDETTEAVLTRLTSLVDTDGLLLVGPSDQVSLPRNEWEHLIRNSVRCYRRRSQEEIATSAPPIPSIREVARTPVQPSATVSVPHAPALPRPQTEPQRRRRVPQSRRPRPVLTTPPTSDLELINDPIQSCLAQTQELANAGRYTDAIALLENHDAGASVRGKLWRGILSLSLEHDEEAVRLFRQCVFLRPDVAEYHRWLGVALETVGRSTEAARAHQNAAELDEQ